MPRCSLPLCSRLPPTQLLPSTPIARISVGLATRTGPKAKSHTASLLLAPIPSVLRADFLLPFSPVSSFTTPITQLSSIHFLQSTLVVPLSSIHSISILQSDSSLRVLPPSSIHSLICGRYANAPDDTPVLYPTHLTALRLALLLTGLPERIMPLSTRTASRVRSSSNFTTPWNLQGEKRARRRARQQQL